MVQTLRAKEGAAWSLAVAEGIATLLIDLPGERVNILSSRVMEELATMLREIARRPEISCLVIRSGKPGTFIAGADLKEIRGVKDSTDAEAKSLAGQDLLNVLDDLPFPTVAVLDGAALGGGLEIALACDFRISTDNPKTQIGLPETSLGIIPGFGGTYRLPRTVGLAQAVPMILSGKPVDGLKAYKIHLVDAFVPTAFLEDRTRLFVRSILTPAGRKAVLRRRRKRRLGIRLLEANPLGRLFLFRAASRDLAKRTGGNYPGPMEALRVLRRTVNASRRKALEHERRVLGALAATPQCAHLVDLFFAQERARKLQDLKGAPGASSGGRPVERAAVIGAGVMGGRIAWLFTKYDIPVVMKDIAWDAVGKGYAAALDVYRELEKRGRFSPRETNLKMHHLSGVLDYRSLGRPDAVIEAVVENIGVKRKVLAELEGVVTEDCLIASNTSSLSIDEMAGSLRHPERFVGMHFFNPPNRMPLVEVIAGERTAAEAVLRAAMLAVRIGKTPVVVKDRAGFLVNRLLMPYLNEALHLLGEGVDYLRADALIQRFGMPMGPFTLLDEIGLDIGYEVAQVLRNAYGERMASPSFFGALRGRVDLLGRKSGKGFYLHRGRRTPNPEMQRLVAASRTGTRPRAQDFDIVHRPVLAMVNEAARALEEGIVGSPGQLDLALILGTGFPPFRGGLLRYADELGIGRVRDTLASYAERYGERFAPAPRIERLAQEGSGFHA